MKSVVNIRPLLLSLSIIMVMMLVAACGTTPTEEPAPQAETQEEAQPTEAEVEAEAEPVEEEATAETGSQEETSTQEEASPEETAEEPEAAPTVQESQISQAVETLGVTVETDEPDVSSPRTKPGGEYRNVSTSDAVNFHPYLTVDATSGGYQGLVYDGALLRLDEETLEYIPNMAESYEISDDGLTFTFHLRHGMEWTDGMPITAQDYKWTYDQIVDPANAFAYLSQYEFITSYEAPDDYTIQAKIDEVFAPALTNIALFITPLPKHIWENLPWDDPEQNPEINSPSVTSGPYKLVEWKRDEFAIFEANENYWYHGAPNMQRYVNEIVPDQDIAFQKLKTGEVDTSGMTPEQLEEARTLDNVTVYEWWPISSSWFYLGLNMREGFPTHDINVRHALNYAIDKELLVDEVWLGQARRLCSIYAETSWAHNPDVPCYEYDPDKAIELFAEAGYTFEDGEMLDENGEQLELNYIYGPNTSKTAELIAVTVQDYLADIGIKVDVQGLEWASFLEATSVEEPDWDLYFGGWRSSPEPHSAATVWAAENIPDLNSVAYINEDVENLFKEAGATYDIEIRKEKYGEIQSIIAEDAPYVFLAYRKSASAQNNRIQGIEPTALGIGWNFEDWYIAKEAVE